MIRGLTLRHPWAVAVAWLHKDTENRLWHPQNEGGRIGMSLAIHGGHTPVAQYDDFDADLAWLLNLFSEPLPVQSRRETPLADPAQHGPGRPLDHPRHRGRLQTQRRHPGPPQPLGDGGAVPRDPGGHRAPAPPV